MPELPEVETTRRGIEKHIVGKKIVDFKCRAKALRWPIEKKILTKQLLGHKITSVTRRAKYLLLNTDHGSAIVHLGMSGHFRTLDPSTPLKAHDHFDLLFSNKKLLRYNDPRRFGALIWSEAPLQHKLLANLGIEPLERGFTGEYLFKLSQSRKLPIKNFIMDQKIVVGVGNIYASEALYVSGISPLRPSSKVSLQEFDVLVSKIKAILKKSIKSGGTTLRDFSQADGKPGYFAQQLLIYGRDGEACNNCGTLIELVRIGQRSSYYCSKCQK